MFLNILEHRTRAVFLDRAERFKFRVETSKKHDVIREVINGLEK